MCRAYILLSDSVGLIKNWQMLKREEIGNDDCIDYSAEFNES